MRFLDQLGGLHLQRFLLHEEHEPRLRDNLSDHPWGPHHPLHHWRSDRQRAQEYLRLVQPARVEATESKIKTKMAATS